MLDPESILHHYLDHIDQSPSWETVVESITTFLNIKEASQWMTGDVLVFIRARMNFNPRRTFEWDGQEIPEEVNHFIRDHYGVRLDQGNGVDFLCWHTIRFEMFWLLCRPGEIKVWEKTEEFTEIQFGNYLERLQGQLRIELSGNRLYNYYRTSLCFPTQTRFPHTWTWHFTTTNLAAKKVQKNLVGNERMKELVRLSQIEADLLVNEGADTVPHLRDKIAKMAHQERGFEWSLPYIPSLSVRMNGDYYDGLLFVSTSKQGLHAQSAIMYALGLQREFYKLPELWLNDNVIELADGEGVAVCTGVDDIQDAFLFMAGKLRLKVRK